MVQSDLKLATDSGCLQSPHGSAYSYGDPQRLLHFSEPKTITMETRPSSPKPSCEGTPLTGRKLLFGGQGITM